MSKPEDKIQAPHAADNGRSGSTGGIILGHLAAPGGHSGTDGGWEARERAWEARREAARASSALAQADIPERYRRPFEDLDQDLQPEAYDVCLAYSRKLETLSGKRGLILMGPPGTGKSTLAGAVLIEAVRGGLNRVEYGDVSRRLEQARDGWDNRRGTGGRRSILSLAEQELVVLDDLGRERLTDWAAEMVYVLVNALYADCRRVIITTNATTEKFNGYVNEAVRSRIEAMCEPVVLAGKNLRGQAAT